MFKILTEANPVISRMIYHQKREFVYNIHCIILHFHYIINKNFLFFLHSFFFRKQGFFYIELIFFYQLFDYIIPPSMSDNKYYLFVEICPVEFSTSWFGLITPSWCCLPCSSILHISCKRIVRSRFDEMLIRFQFNFFGKSTHR